MVRKITTLSLARIRQLEYPELAETILSIVDQYGAETMFVHHAADALRTLVPDLGFLKISGRSNEKSKAVTALHTSRMDIIVGLLKQSRSLVKANLAAHRTDLKLVSPFVEAYWSGIYNFNRRTINARLKLMYMEIEGNARLKAALQAVGLSVFIDELAKLEQDLTVAREALRKWKAGLPKGQTMQIRSKVSNAMTDLVYAIEVAWKAHPELDYMPMINEINQVFTSYQSTIRSRSTRNKNSASAAAAASPTTLATAV